MKKISILLLYTFITSSIMAQNHTCIEIPFSLERNLVIIKVQLSDKIWRDFIFDTGTEGIMILDSLADSLGYKLSGYDTIINPTGEIVGKVEQVLIPSLDFSGLNLTKRNASKMPRHMLFSKTAVGIIGMKVFKDFLITLDYKKSVLILEKGELPLNENVISINLDHILEAKVELNNKAVLAHFDCGGAGYISIPKTWDSIYKLKTEPIRYAKGRTPMGDFDIYKAELNGEIKIGTYKISQPEIHLVTGDFFFAINFGYEFFKEHIVTIDTKNRLMQVVRN